MLFRLAVVALFALAGLSATHEGVQGLQLMSVTVDEGPILGWTPRTYWLYTPTARAGNASMPLVVYFHGQGGGGSPLGGFFDPNTTEFIALADSFGFMVAYMQGLGDGNCGTGWNTLGQNESLDSTCDKTAWTSGGTCCYDSCKKLGKCHHDGEEGYCGWSTCHDDVAYVGSVLSDIRAERAVADGAVYATGASNGGMFLHYLLQRMPTAFRAAAAVFAQPLVGKLVVPPQLRHTALLQVRDPAVKPRGTCHCRTALPRHANRSPLAL